MRRTVLIVATGWVAAAVGLSQPHLTPVRSQPAEKLAVTLRFRDWSPVNASGATVLGGNQTGTGGLFAIDAATGKSKWSFIPKFSGTAYISTVPAVWGNLSIAAFPNGAVIGVSLATGKEVWRGPRPAQNAAVAVASGVAYFAGYDGAIYALDAETGQQRWKAEFNPTLAPCFSSPVIADGTVYVTGIGPAAPNDPTKRGGYYLFAFDAATGKERWRYRAEAPYIHNGVCLTQPVLAGDAVFATGESRLYAVDRKTGRDLWAPILLKRMHDGRIREIKLSNLVVAGRLVVGATPVSLVAFDQASGRVEWELPGGFDPERVSLAVAGNVLYFQGSPAARPAARARGTLYGLDLNTRAILWSFTRTTEEPDWSFGQIAPVDAGLWVDTHKTLLKLVSP